MNEKKMLISGGAGFIGSNLAKEALKSGYDVTVLDNLSEQIHKDDSSKLLLINEGVKFIFGDVRNKDDWKKALRDMDVVVHLAAETGTGQSMYRISHYTDVNIGGTSNLLDILTNESHHVSKVVIASSRAIYGEGKYICRKCGVVYPDSRKETDLEKGDYSVKCPFCDKTVEILPTDEDSKIHPISIYGITKQVQEQMVMNTGWNLGIPTVGLRYQNVYGPGQSLSNPYTGILSIFSTRIMNGKYINIFEDGEESRDFVYIDDVVKATLLCVENDCANHKVFNVGLGKAISVLKVAETLKQAFNSNVEIVITGNYRVGDIRHNIADLTKIKNSLDFKPEVCFEDGIYKFAKWVESQQVQQDLFEKSMMEMRDRGLLKNA